MALSVSNWSRKAKSECKNMSIEELSSSYFFRDPIRPIKNNNELIYSPADGIILDCKEVSSIHESLFTKYDAVTLDNLSYSQIDDGAYWIVTIFLTFYDPHIIRIPTNGNITRLDLPAYYAENKVMLDVENNLLNNSVANIKQELLASISFNQRVLFNIKTPFKKENYHIILTADYDIDTVVSFFSKPKFFKQNTRIASVRYGSMATCIFPKKWNINPLQKTNIHIEAGIDLLFEFL
jgi:phosphatidylserine decarboxylase